MMLLTSPDVLKCDSANTAIMVTATTANNSNLFQTNAQRLWETDSSFLASPRHSFRHLSVTTDTHHSRQQSPGNMAQPLNIFPCSGKIYTFSYSVISLEQSMWVCVSAAQSPATCFYWSLPPECLLGEY